MRVLHEGARGCGYRQPGGLYLCSDQPGQACGLLPVPTTVCPCCGAGIRPARGWTWVDPDLLLPHHDDPAAVPPHPGCPLDTVGLITSAEGTSQAGLIWIGQAYYPTPGAWLDEGHRLGFSRRIAALPRGYVPGSTWVLVGHRKALRHGYLARTPGDPDGQPQLYASVQAALDAGATAAEPHYVPGIFHLWRPSRCEYVVRGTEDELALARLERRGIEPVQVVPVPPAQAPLATVAAQA